MGVEECEECIRVCKSPSVWESLSFRQFFESSMSFTVYESKSKSKTVTVVLVGVGYYWGGRVGEL